MRPAKTQISLGIRPVWSESSLSVWRKLGPLAAHWAHSEDSDQTGWVPRLIWVFAGRTATLVLSRGGSNNPWKSILRDEILFKGIVINRKFSLQDMDNPVADFEHTPPGLLALDNMVFFAQNYKENYIKVGSSLYPLCCRCRLWTHPSRPTCTRQHDLLCSKWQRKLHQGG